MRLRLYKLRMALRDVLFVLESGQLVQTTRSVRVSLESSASW